MLSSSRGQDNFRGLEASRPRPRTSKCVLEESPRPRTSSRTPPLVIIYGDFNAHHKIWNSGTPNQNGISLFAFIEENDYSLQNTSIPTYMVFNAGLKCSLIDLTITSPSISHKCSLEVTNIFMGSDHCVINSKININVSHSSQHLPRWVFKRANWDAFYHLCDLNSNHSSISADVHDFQNSLTSTIMDIAKRTIPTT